MKGGMGVMEITNQVKALILETNVVKVSSVAKEERQQTVQAVEVKVQSVAEKGNTQLEAPESLESAVKNINDYVQNIQRSLLFTVDEISGKDVVTVLDKETDEIIRQYPSEEVLEIARRLRQDKDEAISLFNSQA
jgi:flagellar protein FlaG